MLTTYPIDLADEEQAYLESCARIRRISCTRLVQRLVAAVCRDHLALAVLDDDSRPVPRLMHETTKSHYRRHHVVSVARLP